VHNYIGNAFYSHMTRMNMRESDWLRLCNVACIQCRVDYTHLVKGRPTKCQQVDDAIPLAKRYFSMLIIVSQNAPAFTGHIDVEINNKRKKQNILCSRKLCRPLLL